MKEMKRLVFTGTLFLCTLISYSQFGFRSFITQGIENPVDVYNADLDNDELNAIVYPNPFSNQTAIYFDEELNGDHVLRVFNLLGNEVYRDGQLSGNTYELDGGDFESGLYILTIESFNSQQQVFSTKLIVE